MIHYTLLFKYVESDVMYGQLPAEFLCSLGNPMQLST